MNYGRAFVVDNITHHPTAALRLRSTVLAAERAASHRVSRGAARPTVPRDNTVYGTSPPVCERPQCISVSASDYVTSTTRETRTNGLKVAIELT